MKLSLKPTSLILLLTILGSSLFLHFTNLDWGLPSEKRTLEVMGSKEEMNRLIPKMIEQRKAYYEKVNRLLNKDESFKQAYNDITNRWEVQPYKEISKDIVLDRMRNYLIGVNVSDEQMTMTSVSQLNPLKFDFVPGPLSYYGALYYYTAGAFLVIGKMLGWVSLNPGVEYYFSHPNETRDMYILVRSIGGVSILATLVVLFFAVRKTYGEKQAFWTLLFFAFIPLLVYNSHVTKTHLFGMFWMSFGLLFCWRVLEDNSQAFKSYILSGISLGLCASSLITNLLSGVLLIATNLVQNEWDIKKSLKNKPFWFACLILVGLFGVTNFYIFFGEFEFKRLILANVTYFPSYITLELGQWFNTLIHLFTEQIHWTYLPLLGYGIFLAITKREKFMLVVVITFLVLFLQNLFMTRHPPVNVRMFPFMSLLLGWTVVSLLGSWGGWKKRGLLFYLALTLFLSAHQSLYYNRLHKDPSNLDLAGSWINQNIPKGASIGAWGGGFAPFEFPSIQFLNYKMISIPHTHELDESNPRTSLLPDYLVLQENYVRKDGFPSSKTIQTSYTTIQEFPSISSPFGIPFKRSLIKSGNTAIKILKKNEI